MKKLTKRDKRSNLEKEIDSLIEQISDSNSKSENENGVDDEIKSLLTALSSTQPASDDYEKIVQNLKTLYEIKGIVPDEYETMVKNLKTLTDAKEIAKKPKISKEVLASILGVAGSLAGIILIMSFEKANVITTKAIGFVLRNRV